MDQGPQEMIERCVCGSRRCLRVHGECGLCNGSGLAQVPVLRRTRPQAPGGRRGQAAGHLAAQHDCLHADDESTVTNLLFLPTRLLTCTFLDTQRGVSPLFFFVV